MHYKLCPFLYLSRGELAWALATTGQLVVVTTRNTLLPVHADLLRSVTDRHGLGILSLNGDRYMIDEHSFFFWAPCGK